MDSDPPNRGTYINYLGSLLPQWPEYRGLYRFLEEDVPSFACDTRAFIVDSSGNELSVHSFEDATGFRGALDLRSPETTSRMVFVHYTQTKTVDRAFIDAIGLKFDINPLLFCNHFGSGLEAETRVDWEADGISNYAQLSSQNISLEIGHLFFLHASILFLGGTGQSYDQQPTSKFYDSRYYSRSLRLLMFRCSFGTRTGQQSCM